MNRIVINASAADARISRHIYGHFSEHLGRCIYGGFWAGRSSPIPNVRGICDEYHWTDGIGSPQDRPKMINTHWGGVTEDNSFGTHEFLDLCEQLSDPDGLRCEPYICGNVGTVTIIPGGL